MSWKVTVRNGPKVERLHFADLDQALAAAERRARELAGQTSKKAVDVKFRTYEPVQQVAARIELAGPQRLVPRVRAGLDVRGDGSTEAYFGRLRREVVEPRKGETPYRALRRVVTAQGES